MGKAHSSRRQIDPVCRRNERSPARITTVYGAAQGPLLAMVPRDTNCTFAKYDLTARRIRRGGSTKWCRPLRPVPVHDVNARRPRLARDDAANDTSEALHLAANAHVRRSRIAELTEALMPIFLANYQTLDGKRNGAGVVRDGIIHDLGYLLGREPLASLSEAYAKWAEVEAALKIKRDDLGPGIALADVLLLPPSTEPSAVYFAGFNYRDHVANMFAKANLAPDPDPKEVGLKPWHGLKPRNSLCGTGSVVELPTEHVDWEVELAVVIGRSARRVSVQDAVSYIAGYTVAIDLSARDLAFRPHTPVASVARMDWLLQKGLEGFCPLGPWLTPRWAIKDPQNLGLRLSVNGVTKQDSNTSNMIFSVAEAISHISNVVTLSPGDVILTGTPAGTGAESGEFLKPGDEVSAWVESVGELTVKTTAWQAERFY